jgi:hypothetical protein
MTLKEKFKKIDIKLSENHTTKIVDVEAMKCEKIADDYAIDFLEWCENKNVFSPSVIHKPTYNKLLIQFKKEKGL